MAKKTSDTKRRAKVKNLPKAEQALTEKQAKKVKGGIIIINNQPADHNYKPIGSLIPNLIGNPGIGKK